VPVIVTRKNESGADDNEQSMLNANTQNYDSKPELTKIGSQSYLERSETLSRPCYKVVTCDVKDEIIDLQASMMSGLARQACLK
jgi:hypothetical protein